MTVTRFSVKTTHGTIAVAASGGKRLPLVMIHGNSSTKEVFRAQLESPLADAYGLIAIDLPGHGQSENATDPARTYHLPGLARACAEVLDAMSIARAAIYGWSLGGHVAMEMTQHWKGIAGLMITGAPPAEPSPAGMAAAFLPHPALAHAGSEILPPEAVDAFLGLTLGRAGDPVLHEAALRCDGRSRRMIFESIATGQAADERKIVSQLEVPLAIVDGECEPFANPEYIAGLAIGSLWEGVHHRLEGLGHAPFYEDPQRFNALLLRFLRDLARREKARGGAATPASDTGKAGHRPRRYG